MEEATRKAPVGPDDHGRRRLLQSVTGPDRPGGAARAVAAETAGQVHPCNFCGCEKRDGFRCWVVRREPTY